MTTKALTIARGAFSLVEVLIAVLILAIGLLGLGAVIPVVVREQRLAADATQGVIVANAARNMIAGPLTTPGRTTPAQLPEQLVGRVSALDAWLDDPTWSPDYLWMPWVNGGRNIVATVITPPGAPVQLSLVREEGQLEYGFNPDNGLVWWSHRVNRNERPNTSSPWTTVSGTTRQELTVRDRLWPTQAVIGMGAGEAHRPQFVWDIVARRVDSRRQPGDRFRIDNPAEMQVAIFVRRIDLNIRVPQGRTLFQVLTDTTLPANERRVPVGVASTGTTQGMPTRDGTNGTAAAPTIGAYAAPLVLDANAVIDPITGLRNRMELSGNAGLPGSNGRVLAAQVGQPLVDNLGNIYTVREADTDAGGPYWVRVDPPFPDMMVLGPAGPVQQVVFTPQIPAAVTIVNITRPVVQP